MIVLVDWLRYLSVIGTMLFALVMASPTEADDERVYDSGAVLALVGRHAIAHACPVGPQHALTAAHVTDIRWYDDDAPLVPYRYENENGEFGLAVPLSVYTASDTGWVRLSSALSMWYRYADGPPEIGSRVYWVEYDVHNKKNALKAKYEDAKVINVVAGNIFVDRAPIPGSSGGCVWNENGEIVGIVSAAWKISKDYRSDFNVGAFVGVYSPWGPDIPKDKNAEQESSEEEESGGDSNP
jgi:hypothetical protein